MTSSNKEPLSLGFEGENWYPEIESLGVIIPGTNKQVMVTFSGNEYFVYHASAVQNDIKWLRFDSLLMAAAYVRNFIDGYAQMLGKAGQSGVAAGGTEG